MQNADNQTVYWSVVGNSSADTSIDASGLLTVAANETAAHLIVTATPTHAPHISDAALMTATPLGIPGYVNGDGVVTALDVMLLRLYLAGHSVVLGR